MQILQPALYCDVFIEWNLVRFGGLLLKLLLPLLMTDNMILFCVAQTLLSLSKLASLAVPELSDDLITNVDGTYVYCIIPMLLPIFV